MTETTQHPANMPAEDSDFRALDKDLVFAALAEAGIKTLVIEFNGSGDSGQIEDIAASAKPLDHLEYCDHLTDADRIPFPSNQAFEVASPVPADPPSPTNLQEAIEILVYDYLAKTHYGWENDDGAYGTFVFDVTARTITLEYYERFTDVKTYHHAF